MVISQSGNCNKLIPCSRGNFWSSFSWEVLFFLFLQIELIMLISRLVVGGSLRCQHFLIVFVLLGAIKNAKGCVLLFLLRSLGIFPRYKKVKRNHITNGHNQNNMSLICNAPSSRNADLAFFSHFCEEVQSASFK